MNLIDLVDYTSIQDVGTVFHISLYDEDSVEVEVLQDRGGREITMARRIASVHDCNHPSKLRVFTGENTGKLMIDLESIPSNEQRRTCIEELFTKDYNKQIKWMRR